MVHHGLGLQSQVLQEYKDTKLMRNTYGNTVTVNCDGQSQTIEVGPLYLNGSKKHLGSVQFTVGHNADGTKSAGISLSSNMSNISYGSFQSFTN